MDYEERVCDFKKYAKQTLDLMVDAFKWQEMAKDCEDKEIQSKYMGVSNTLFELFMMEHKNMQEMFSKEEM